MIAKTTAIQTAELENYYCCKHCSFCSNNSKQFKDHIFSRRSPPSLQCDLCTFKSCTSIGMQTHTEKMHSSLSMNFEIVHKIQPLQTTVVRKTSRSKTKLVSSQISDFSAPPAKFRHQCKYCKKRFWRQAVYNFHILTHAQKRSFKCNRCSSVFNSQAKQKKHIFARRSGPVQKCLHCEMTFCFQRTLTAHVKATHADSDEPIMPVLFKYGKDLESMVGNPTAEEPMETFQDPSPSNLSEESTSTEKTILEKVQEKLIRLETDPEGISASQKARFICHLCKKTFKTRAHLQHHLAIIHTDKGPFKCNLCSYVTTSSSHLQRHQEISKSRNGNSFFCNECDFNSCSSNYFRTHLSENHPEEEASLSEQSQQIWPQKSMPKVFEEDLANPEVVKQIYSEESIPSLELLEKAKPSLLIATTIITTASRWSPQDLQPEREKTQEVCRYCKKVFEGSHRERDLQEHIRNHNEIMEGRNVERDSLSDKPYKCKYCDYRSKHRSTTRTHERIHTGEKPFRCDICSKQFSDGSSFRKHRFIHPRTNNTGISGRNLRVRKVNLMNPIIRNPASTKIKSGESAQNAGKKKGFIKKTKVYAPPKMHKCKFCPYESKQRSHIVAHARTHTREKPFQCSDCPYRTAWKHDLKKHKIRHVTREDEREIQQTKPLPQSPLTGTQPLLPKPDLHNIKNKETFKKHLKSRLSNHRSGRRTKIKSDERMNVAANELFECDACGFEFSQRSSLDDHMETHFTEYRKKHG